jgi:zinc-ribbon domain
MVEQPERYCTNCGQELKPEDQFCTNCGMPVHRAARVPTPEADRPVPPLPPPTQEAGRRSLTGSGAFRGHGSKLVVLLVLGVLVLYLVLPLVIESLESLIAGKVKTALETPTKPHVEIISNFSPMMLLGSIDRVQVTGLPYPWDVGVDLKGVSVSVPNLIVGNLSIEAESCSPPRVQNIDQIQCQQFGK